MSKLDQLRRQREEQHARQQEQTAATKTGTPAAPVARVASAASRAAAPETESAAPSPPPAAPVRAPRKSKDAAADALEGVCSVCGKTRPLANGLVSNHQKGFGKMCAGSRKEPK